MRDPSRTSASHVSEHVSRFAPVRSWITRERCRLQRSLARVLQATMSTARATWAMARFHATPAWRRALRIGALTGLVGCESGLLLISLVPQTMWANLGHPDGPLPHALFPLVAGLFYVIPLLTGALCRRWPAALVLATLPAWGDLGVFAVAAAPRLGPFYLAQDPHAVGTVGTLELFAALGFLGWIARRALRDLLDGQERWKAAH